MTSSLPTRHVKMIELLREAIQVAKRSREMGKHPFGAILVENGTDKILMQHTNVNSAAHAESELARAAGNV